MTFDIFWGKKKNKVVSQYSNGTGLEARLGDPFVIFFLQFPFLIKLCSLFSAKKTNDAHSLHNSVTLD